MTYEHVGRTDEETPRAGTENHGISRYERIRIDGYSFAAQPEEGNKKSW